MSYNIWLWNMVLFMYMLDMPTCVESEVPLPFDAVAGQNVSLPCMVHHINEQQTVKWWSINAYISSGKMIGDVLGTTKTFYDLPGEGLDYRLLIVIPDDIRIWKSLMEVYECRLVPGNDGKMFTTIESYELQIYQPKCTIIHINGSTSVASCSYQNIPEFQGKWLIDGSSVDSMGNCTSDVCTLNYTYNPSEVNAQDLVCSVMESGRELSRTKPCSMQNYITTSPLKTTEESRTSTSPTLHLTTENLLDSLTKSTSNKGDITSKMIITNTETTSTIMTIPVTTNIETTSTTMTTSVTTNTETTSTIMTIPVTTNTETTSTIMTTPVTTNIETTSTIMTTTFLEGGTEMFLLVILSVAGVIIGLLFLIILLYFVRRSFKVKQNSSTRSRSADENVYVENDQEKHTQTISMMERPAQNALGSEMEENSICQSADTNADEQNRNIDKGNVAMRLSGKEKIQADEAYVEIGDILAKKNMNKKRDGPTTSQTCNKVETSDDLGYVENENEAYQSLDEVNERTGNAGIVQEGLGRTQAIEQNDVKPVHYDVLEREA